MLTVLEKVDVLQKVSVFCEIRTESLARVAAVAEEVNCEPGHVLLRENDAADTTFVLLEGEVAVMRDGREVKRLGSNELVGLLPLLAGEPLRDSAVATRPTRALQIDQQDLYDVMAEDFNVTQGIVRALVALAAGGSS